MYSTGVLRSCSAKYFWFDGKKGDEGARNTRGTRDATYVNIKIITVTPGLTKIIVPESHSLAET